MTVTDQIIRQWLGLSIVWTCATIWWIDHYFYNVNNNKSFGNHKMIEVDRRHRLPVVSKDAGAASMNVHQPEIVDESWRRLQKLGINISSLSPDIKRQIPLWSTILSQYYDININNTTNHHVPSQQPQPIIMGLSQCAAYRAKVPWYDRVVAPAGLFHSGTNLLVQLLQANCPYAKSSSTNNHTTSRYGTIQGQVRGLAWQVSWGKHNPASWARDQPQHYAIDHDIYRHTPVDVQLPIILLRHPYDWMERMCTWSYSVYFPKTTHPQPQPQQQTPCPWILDANGQFVPVLAKWGVGDRVYTSLAHLWKEWYQEYIIYPTTPLDYPRLVVRLEDLIFLPDLVISKICHCAGRVYLPDVDDDKRHPFQAVLPNAKSKDGGHDATTTTHSMMGLLDAWIQYGNVRNYTNFTQRHVTDTALDSKLLEAFHYQLN